MFPATTLIRAISLLLPSSRRQDWIAEWSAEIEHAWAAARREGQERVRLRARLGLRALDSLPDALWLRRRNGGGGWFWTMRDSVRTLGRHPGFALAVICTLALGIGSATAIYTVLDALVLRPIPFRNPEQLVTVTGRNGVPNLDPETVNQWTTHGASVFQELHAHRGRAFILTGAGEAKSYRAELIEPGFLGMLGVSPLLGRDFTPEEARPGNDHVLMLSNQVWTEAFGRDRGVLGRTVELDGEPYSIVGVLPPTIRLAPGGVVHLMLPLTDPRPPGSLSLLGRLGPGVDIEAAGARLAAVSEALTRDQPRPQGWQVGLQPLSRNLDRAVLSGFWTLGAAVFCLLVIACANAAGLLLLRAVSRRPELAVRVALGSSRAALVRHVFVESMLLAVAAGALGTLIAWIGVRGLVSLMPSVLIRFSYSVVGIDQRVLAFSIALTLATGLVFGVLPAWRTAAAAGAGRRTSTASRREVQLRAALQVGQLALAVVLLSGAALFGRSFDKLTSVPLGYAVDEILELQLVSLERLRRDPEGTAAFARDLDTRLASLPGVRGVARVGDAGFSFDWTIELEDGSKHTAGSGDVQVLNRTFSELLPFQRVDTAYFDVMGISIVEGRGFRAGDAELESPVVVLDRDLASRLWPGQSAVGRRFRIDEGDWLTVVGVTRDVKLRGPHDPLGALMLFYAGSQRDLRSATVMIRTEREPETLITDVRALVQQMDPDQPIEILRASRVGIGESVADPRFRLVIMGVFAAVAVALASIGLYGLVSFTVAQRRREIGVRMAMGARASRVVRQVVGQGIGLAVVGLVIGLLATALLSRFVSALLFEVSPVDPATLVAAGLILLLACTAALLAPARRAAMVDPATALRSE